MGIRAVANYRIDHSALASLPFGKRSRWSGHYVLSASISSCIRSAPRPGRSRPPRSSDTAIYAEILAEDWVDIPLAPGQEQGPSGMAGQIAAFRAAMPDYDVKHEDLIVGGDRLAVRNTVSGTHLGAFMGHAPTGRRIEMRTMDIHQVRDNRIVATWHLEDFAGLMAQLTAPSQAPVRAAWS